ncbi:sensor histidine kinase [Nonomuraea sp. NPDC046802]|uniref:sensor histidine kinase n=1 Tax=Nonomuraea sp. NPDC046802 TaxID=3154919 RepID=UPI0033F1B182
MKHQTLLLNSAVALWRASRQAVDRLRHAAVADPGVLAGRLTQAVGRSDPAQALTSVVSVLREGMAVEGVAVEVTGGEPRYVENGRVGAEARELPLVWHGQRVGRLLVGPPGPRRLTAAHREQVLAVLAPYAAGVAHAVRMTADLQHVCEHLQAAREEERRRLCRDLHDGLGQTLSALAMTIAKARLEPKDSPEAVDGLLEELHTRVNAVTYDIRELVYGLRPHALDELGLAPAVRELAGQAPPDTEVVVEGSLSGLPAPLEVAVYRIVQEALTNVRKHAEASLARIVLRRRLSALRVLIADDGEGLPEAYCAGVGLRSMRERAAEWGGTIVIDSEPGAGTRVEVVLPLRTGPPHSSAVPLEDRRCRNPPHSDERGCQGPLDA